MPRISSFLSILVVFVLPVACSGEDPADFDVAPELDPGGLLGKDDSAGIAALPVDGNYAATAVWRVRNQWEDTNTTAARAAGLAWAADSGLNWDQKFARWIGTLERVAATSYGETFQLTTPFGRSLPAPKLDCADVAIMLRASFAAWYNLPFYVVAQDGSTTVYFGHFGVRTDGGIWNNMPRFAEAYRDHSGMSPAEYGSSWPQDKSLRARGVQDGDEQVFLGPGLRTGAYLDEIHLNKRAAHFIRLLLIFTGSPHLADSRNTFNLVPEALRAGDTLLYRRARRGTGHTMVVVRAESIGEGRLQAESVYGNLPPDQPTWEDAPATKRRFTDNEGGGPTMNSEGEVYARIGGGLKRWRVAKNVGGRWMNTWMAADESSWINDRDFDRIGARPAQFDTLLGEVSPEARRDLLLQVIEAKRRHLSQYPASCSAREGRERAFDDLYVLLQTEFGLSRAQVDQTYRTLPDYVFAELDYLRSKTCCWNRTTPQMYQLIMSYNEGIQETACTPPVVFMARGGGYALFRDYAAANGRGSEWVEWSEDEDCPQRGVTDDTEASHAWTPWCDLGMVTPPPPSGCTDDMLEPNDEPGSPRAIDAGSYTAMLCGGNEDFFAVTGHGGTLSVTIGFDHTRGDLDLEVLSSTGDVLGSSAGTSNEERVEVATASGQVYQVRVYGYRGAEAAYTLDVALR